MLRGKTNILRGKPRRSVLCCGCSGKKGNGTVGFLKIKGTWWILFVIVHGTCLLGDALTTRNSFLIIVLL